MMRYRIDDFETDHTWLPSVGEKLDKIHFRKGNWHAECDPTTGWCTIHYDKHDPYKSLSSLANHLADSNSGKVLLVIAIVGILDQLLIGGQIRKSILSTL